MAKVNIPLRPSRKRYSLTEKEMNCLTWYVLSGCKREEAYQIFVRPDLVVSKKNLSTATSQFFTAMEVREYIAAYRALLEGKTVSDNEAEPTGEDKEKRKAKAVDSFTDKVIDKMNGSIESVEEMDAVAKMADRVGMFEEKDKVETAPVRILPARCKSECRYRLFVEGVKLQGKIFDDCEYCKARRYAEEHGFKYDPCTVLDVPHEVIDEIDSKNKVKLSDILSGKVEN